MLMDDVPSERDSIFSGTRYTNNVPILF